MKNVTNIKRGLLLMDDELEFLKTNEGDLTNEDCEDDYDEEYGEELEIKDDD